MRERNIKFDDTMKVALVHDYILNYGGAERVLESLHKIFPEAKIYTLLYDKKMSKYFPEDIVQTSFLNKLPNFIKKRHKFLLPFFPVAVESLDLSSYDVVISSSSAFAKGVITRPKTIHICYCHSPSRFLWDYNERYLNDENYNVFLKPIVKFLTHKTRIWDRASAERVDFWIANSKTTQNRIKKFYRKDSVVIYPPVEKFSHTSDVRDVWKDYFLAVSRLSPYKKIDLIVKAFNKLELPLVIAGSGRDMKRLRKMAKKNIEFLGFVSDEELANSYENCKAFVMAHEEDFGIAPIEAMYFGKPVLAYKKGGAEEWLEEGKTGEFFEASSPEALADGVRRLRFNMTGYDKNYIMQKADFFSFERFKKEIIDFIDKSCDSENFS